MRIVYIKSADRERLCSLSKIQDVVSEFTQLKANSNGNYLGLCPFHKERTPSFVVTPRTDTYKCFGCGRGGKSALKFIIDVKGITYMEAINYLAQKYDYTCTDFNSVVK